MALDYDSAGKEDKVKLLSMAKLIADIPDSEYAAGDEVTILAKAGKDTQDRQGWWIEKLGAEDVATTYEANLIQIIQ